MNQLLVLMLQYVFIGICGMIDTAFINNAGVLTRIPVMLLMYYIGCGILSFAIPCTVDFSVRALFYMV